MGRDGGGAGRKEGREGTQKGGARREAHPQRLRDTRDSTLGPIAVDGANNAEKREQSHVWVLGKRQRAACAVLGETMESGYLQWMCNGSAMEGTCPATRRHSYGTATAQPLNHGGEEDVRREAGRRCASMRCSLDFGSHACGDSITCKCA